MGWQDQNLGGDPYSCRSFFLSILNLIERIGMSFSPYLFGSWKFRNSKGVLFTSGLERITATYRATTTHTTGQAKQLDNTASTDILAYTFSSSSFGALLHLSLLFGLCCSIFDYCSVSFSSHIHYHSIFIEGACLVGFLWISFSFRFLFSPSHIILYLLHALETCLFQKYAVC